VSAEDKTPMIHGDSPASEEELPLEAFMEDMPPEKRMEFSRVMSTLVIGSTMRSSPQMEFVKKLSPEHISKELDNEAKQNEREYEDRKSARKYHFYYGVSALLFFLLFALLFLALGQSALLEKILIPVVTLVGGLAAGGGVGYHAGYKKGKEEE
jgi:chorismate-pyruvate lyase